MIKNKKNIQKPVTEDSDFEIGDFEQYSYDKDLQYSHQALVMQSMRKVIELGSKELRPGWYNQTIDKNGNTILKYIDDTRKSFLEAIKTLEMYMECDLDDEARDNIIKIKETINERKEDLLKEESEEWKNLPIQLKRQWFAKGFLPRPGYFNLENIFYHRFIDEQLDLYREVFKELNKLTRRLDFYKTEDFEA